MAAQRTLPVKQITLNMALAVDSISFDAVRVALNLVANMQRLEMTARFFIQRLELSGISEKRRQPVSVTIEKIDVLSLVITGAERLDPVRVMIENYEPGKGRITITCYGKAWTAAWFAMGGDDVQTFIKRVSNEYLIGYFDPQLRSTVDDDNDANLLFVKSEIIKLRREREIDAVQAREMWDEAENADDVKESCCCFGVGNKLLNLFGDDPWYADWPTAPNPKYQYLERVLNAVRDGLKQIEKVEP